MLPAKRNVPIIPGTNSIRSLMKRLCHRTTAPTPAPMRASIPKRYSTTLSFVQAVLIDLQHTIYRMYVEKGKQCGAVARFV